MECGTPLPWNFERKVKFCFIGRPCLLGFPEICKRKLQKWIFLSIETLLGNPEGTRLPGTLTDGPRRLWKRNVYLYGSSAKGTWGEAPLLSILKDMYSKAMERASVCTGARWATWRGVGVIYRRLWEIVQEGYVNRAPLSMAALWRESGGSVPLLGTLQAT